MGKLIVQINLPMEPLPIVPSPLIHARALLPLKILVKNKTNQLINIENKILKK